MFRASRTLLRVAAIVGTVFGALILACVPAMFVIGCSPTIRDMLIKSFEDGTITVHSSGDFSAKDFVFFFQFLFVFLAVLFIIIGGCCVANAIIATKTRNEPTRGRYIACIITGALSTDFSIIAGIFGLICLARQQRQKKLEE